jgi:hypothetical protein
MIPLQRFPFESPERKSYENNIQTKQSPKKTKSPYRAAND